MQGSGREAAGAGRRNDRGQQPLPESRFYETRPSMRTAEETDGRDTVAETGGLLITGSQAAERTAVEALRLARRGARAGGLTVACD